MMLFHSGEEIFTSLQKIRFATFYDNPGILKEAEMKFDPHLYEILIKTTPTSDEMIIK